MYHFAHTAHTAAQVRVMLELCCTAIVVLCSHMLLALCTAGVVCDWQSSIKCEIPPTYYTAQNSETDIETVRYRDGVHETQLREVDAIKSIALQPR